MPRRRYPRLLIYEQVCGQLLFDPVNERQVPSSDDDTRDVGTGGDGSAGSPAASESGESAAADGAARADADPSGSVPREDGLPGAGG